MSLLFPDHPPVEERLRRLRTLGEEDLAWLVTVSLDDASGPYAGMPDAEFWPIARAKLRRWSGLRARLGWSA